MPPGSWVTFGLRGDTLAASGDVVFDVGSGDTSVTSGDGVTADVGVESTAVTSSLEPQAAVTATRASPAMNRADPRGARLAGRVVESGVMQEAAACNRHGSSHCTTGGQGQAEEPSPRASAAGIGTAGHRGRHRRRGRLS
jgi:hypothetical protein